MKSQFFIFISMTSLLLTNKAFGQFISPPTITPNTAVTSTGGSVGIGIVAPAAKLQILSTTNQLRLANSSTIYSDINSTATGLIFKPSIGGRIAFGLAAPATGVGFHSNMGSFMITDPASTIRGFQVIPSRLGNGEVPFGTTILSSITTSGEGLSIATCGSGAAGVKLGAYAYRNGLINSGWKSIWETQNSINADPNLLILKSGGNIGIGLGATIPTQVLDVNGNFSLRGSNFIYNTTDGIINWGGGSAGNLYFRTLATQGNTSTYTDRMTILNNGNVGIGAPAPGAKLEVAGQLKITGGAPGIGKVLTSDAAGLANWTIMNGLLAGGTTNYIPKWTSANTLSSSSIYDDGTNVGIGTSTPSEHFQIGDRFVFHDGGNKYLGYNSHYDGTNNVRLVNDYSSSIGFGAGDINFQTDVTGTAGSIINSTTKLIIKNTGNIGIGTSSPAAKLDILNTNSQLRLSNTSAIFSEINTTSNGNLLFNLSNTSASVGFGIDPDPDAEVGFHSNMGKFMITDPTSTIRGLQVVPSRSVNGNIPSGTTILSSITTSGEGLSIATCGNGEPGVKLGAYAYGANSGGWKSIWETTNNPSSSGPELLLTKNGGNVGIGTGAIAPRATLDINGKVIIGTTLQTGTHSDAMLTIDGKMVAKSCYITISNWADYVFAKDYKLPNLYDIEKYYLANNHLPEIPSEKEVIENGIDVAEMNKLLLKKIEELTILMVKQQKDIDLLKQK